jgi:phosphoribosyl 1,2-cyclic phosphodiesterase
LVRFWGVRGSVPAPGPDTVRYGGNTACVEFRSEGGIIILDAGTGIRPLAEEFKGRPLDLTLLITHFHWDHIQGQ